MYRTHTGYSVSSMCMNEKFLFWCNDHLPYPSYNQNSSKNYLRDTIHTQKTYFCLHCKPKISRWGLLPQTPGALSRRVRAPSTTIHTCRPQVHQCTRVAPSTPMHTCLPARFARGAYAVFPPRVPIERTQSDPISLSYLDFSYTPIELYKGRASVS